MIPDDIVKQLARGEDPPLIDPIGTAYSEALEQARGILMHHEHDELVHPLVALITKIQQQQKSIEMFEYNQRWRKRRP